MAASLPKTHSHRKLLKQKTRELIDYHTIAPRSSKHIVSKVTDITNTLAIHKDHDTSINLDRSLDTSLSKRIHGGSEIKIKKCGAVASNNQIRNGYLQGRRPYLTKFKSVEALPKNTINNGTVSRTFSVKRLTKNSISASQPKLTSLENLEIP